MVCAIEVLLNHTVKGSPLYVGPFRMPRYKQRSLTPDCRQFADEIAVPVLMTIIVAGA